MAAPLLPEAPVRALLATIGRRHRRRAATCVALGVLTLGTLIGACTEYQVFDSAAYLRGLYAERAGKERAAAIEVPFELADDIRAFIAASLKPARNEETRADDVSYFIFRDLNLRYALNPTRNATDTFRSREGNCLSFVNLFVGIAREVRLNPFYVEVTDYNRWHFRQGMVVSQGHIVAGMRVEGVLRTYDFLPYRPKAYKEFKPIDDITAAAHFYNNLGGEALLEGENERALQLVTTAIEISPTLDKAINNRAVCLSRLGRSSEALTTLEHGLELDPGNPAMLSNLARVYQNLGNKEKAAEVLSQLEGFRIANPFFYLYKGELALSLGDNAQAVDYMKQAYRLDSEIPEVHIGLSKAYLAVGDLERARHHLERALKLDATNPEALRLAELLRDRS